ncbi:hypothetical protein KR067_010696 [Drosophila pandora]|nr:hypothetical protein KR067_010696 [Drosophila pandora]
MELALRRSFTGFLFLLLVILEGHKVKTDIAGCHFYDTVNLTSSQKFENGSYFYQGVEITPNRTGEYSHVLLPDGDREPVKSHWRGCVCQLKTCIRLCCPPNQYMTPDNVCVDGLEEETWSGHYVDITSGNDTKSLDFHKDFVHQGHLPQPCSDLYNLDENEGTLFENGTFLRHYDNESLTKQEYCIQPLKFNDSIQILPFNCAIKSGPDWGKTVAISTSIVCIVVTIGVTCLTEKLRNFDSICLISYMASLGLGSLMQLLDSWQIPTSTMCEPTGYLGYFFIMAAFCWLSVISWYAGKRFAKKQASVIRIRNPVKKYLVNSGYALGMPALLTIVVVLLDYFLDKDEYEAWMPGVGIYNCWIKSQDWSAMIYLYGPILIVITYNMTVFVKAATNIVTIKMNTRKSYRTEESHASRGVYSEMQIFMICVKLFLIMGVSWSLVIISYLVENDDLWSTIFLPSDFINYSQGTIILVVVVLPAILKR